MMPLVSRTDLLSARPEIFLSAAGALILLLEAFLPALRRLFTALALLGVGSYLLFMERLPAAAAFSGTLDGSLTSSVIGALLGLSALVVLLATRQYLERAVKAGLLTETGEFYALFLWGIAGLSLMARGLDLLVIFLGLETFSLCFYALAAYYRTVRASAEAGVKYFLTGAFASSFTLFGIALVFGNTGSTKLSAMAAAPGADPLLMIGLIFLLGGFGFKIALVPFHSWAPDVYAGMPTPAVAYLSVAPKGAALLVLFRLFSSLFGGALPTRFQMAIAAMAVASMCLGNLVALAQRDLKRLLAYSGIAHMGYVAIALAVFGREALAAVLIYLFAYAASNIGAFAAAAALQVHQEKPLSIGLLAGAGRTAPFSAFVLALSMFSLAGIPATAGFIGKFFVFKVAIEKHLLWLALVGVANSLVSLGYYLRVVYVLYMRPALDEDTPPPVAPASRAALALSALGVLAIGLYPAPLANLAEAAARIFPGLAP